MDKLLHVLRSGLFQLLPIVIAKCNGLTFTEETGNWKFDGPCKVLTRSAWDKSHCASICTNLEHETGLPCLSFYVNFTTNICHMCLFITDKTAAQIYNPQKAFLRHSTDYPEQGSCHFMECQIKFPPPTCVQQTHS